MRKLKLEELNRVDIATFKQQEKIPVVVLCDNIRSMHNVGSIFRTADAFNINKVYLCGFTPRPPHKEIRKTALGATESVAWEFKKDVIELASHLKEDGYTLVAMEQTDGSVEMQEFDIDTNQKFVIILGNEVEGVQQELIDHCDYAIEIPQSGTKHSLNVSVCTGIVLWEFYSKFI